MSIADRVGTKSRLGPPRAEGALYEIVDGEFTEKTMGARESELATILGRQLDDFARSRELGRGMVETIFDFRPILDRGRRPDVAFISAEQYPLSERVPEVAAWHIVPEIAIEIVSPTHTANEVQDKLVEYFQVGVSGVWVVFPRTAQIYVYASPTSVRIFGRGDTLEDEAIIPGFRLEIDAFFGPAVAV